MSNSLKPRLRIRRRSPLLLIAIILLWSLILGWGFAQAIQPPKQATIGTVDIVPAGAQLAQQAYLENCATCHIGIPPAVLPTQTWRNLLQDSQHYGATLTPLVDPTRSLVWNYLKTYSRQALEEERIPYRIGESKYFKILHPKINLSRSVSLGSCATCHPGANQYNFRSLSANWENAP